MEGTTHIGNDVKRKSLYLFVLIIVISSILASLLSHNFGKVDIKTIKYDATRGAVLDATLYTPFNMSPTAKLPAVIVTHGAGVSKGIMAGIAEELARRKFVVLNVSRYGSGSSEVPSSIDERPNAIYDSLQYLRTLGYVDQTRIGLTGHSAGGSAVSGAGALDGSLYSLNDMMINALHDTFGQQFTQDEIYMDADTLAEERLSADQLQWYKQLKQEAEEYLYNRVNAILILGRADEGFYGPQTVTVGGYEVTRTPFANGGYLNGIYNEGSANTAAFMMNREEYHTIFQTDSIVVDMWYQVMPYTSDQTPTSVEIGSVWETSVTSSETLADAIADRSVMVFFTPRDNHSQNFISAETTTDIIKFFEQTLGYNNGELSDPNTDPIDAKNTFFLYRETLNGIAMMAMFLALIAFASVLLNTSFFKECKFKVGEPLSEKKSKAYWIITAIMMVVSGWAIWYVGEKGMDLGRGRSTAFLSLSATVWQYIFYLIFVGIAIFVVFAGYLLITKYYLKKDLKFLRTFNVTMKLSAFAKTVLLAYLLFLAAYASMAILQYFLNQDYRFWMAVFTDMKPEYFMLMLRYGLVIFLPLVLFGIFVNFGRMKDMSEGRDTALNVILATVPVWIAYFVCYVPFYAGWTDMPLSRFITTWPLLLLIPVVAYISRKMYNLSGSVWLGALVNTFLLTWAFCSPAAASIYVNGDLLLKWFGL